MNHLDIFHHPDFPGLRFRVHIEQDDTNDAPWDREDGHGPVRNGYQHEKRPGERVLGEAGARDVYWLYDWQAACKMARAEKWNTQPFDAPNRIERVVQADFDRLRGWLRNDWYYVGVCVEVIDENNEALTEKYAHACWGIESDCRDYLLQVALEQAADAAAGIKEFLKDADDLKADAERWQKFCRLAQRKDLGTEADPDTGKLTYPLYRRFYFDTKDLTAESPSAALDSLKEPE